MDLQSYADVLRMGSEWMMVFRDWNLLIVAMWNGGEFLAG